MTSPFLIGKKTVLRPLVMDDAPFLNKWVNDPENRRYMTTSIPISEITEKGWIEKQSAHSMSPASITFVIETKKGKPIGTMGLNAISWVHRHATTGSMIGDKAYRGKGYAKDAKMVLLQYAFDTLGLHKIISHAFAVNLASTEYNKRCGYVQEAVLKDEFFREGRYHDVAVLACFRPTWAQAAKKLGYL